MPMTREEAMKLAQQRFGFGAVVGVNFNYRKRFHVGCLEKYGIWEKRGVGNSWEEAFANVEDFPDGKPPRSHGAKNAPDRP